jgi:hypothetical protein
VGFAGNTPAQGGDAILEIYTTDNAGITGSTGL